MMFWRLLGRLLRAGRGRFGLALLALVGGGAVSAALLNLQLDAERKLTQEFRVLGANVIVLPPRPRAGETIDPPLMDQSELVTIEAARTDRVVAAAPYLYVVARLGGRGVIVAGTWLDEARKMLSWWTITGESIGARDDLDRCLVGRTVARRMGIGPGDTAELDAGGRVRRLRVAGLVSAGGSEDSQIFVNLPVAQQLAGLEGKIGMVQLSVRGSPLEIEGFTTRLLRALPDREVRPLRQLTQSEGDLLARIRLLIAAMVLLILGLTALTVLSTLASLALERRRDVGLMKALGGSTPRIVRLFLTEVSLLGAAGGVLGALLGRPLGSWIGRGAFDTPITWRPEVLPLTVALMMAAALAGALPLRLLGRVPPSVILRSE